MNDVQNESRRGRPPITSKARGNFRHTLYLSFLDFVLLDLKERFIGAASSCAQVCKLLDNWERCKREDFGDLLQLYEGLLPDGDFPSKTSPASYFQMVTSPSNSNFPSKCPLYTSTPETFTTALKVCHKTSMPLIFALLENDAGVTLSVTAWTANQSFSRT